jgi:GNAT superfamily N-acetyltransferase
MHATTMPNASRPSGTVTIEPVVGRRALKRFIQFPYDLYRGEKYWVPPLRVDVSTVLNSRKNPFFGHGRIQPFLAVDSHRHVVGRIAAIVNGMHLQKYEDGNGFFGFFECVDDPDVANRLLDAASNWLAEQGLTGVRGPTNPSMNDTSGLLVDGFDRYPFVLMPYNKPYYEDYLTEYGFERAMTMWAYYLSTSHALSRIGRLVRGRDLILRRYPSLRVRQVDMNHFEKDAAAIRHIYNEAWSENWGHVAMTDAEFDHLAKDIKQILDPRMAFLVEDDGEPIAFAVSIPDVNKALRHVRDGRLLPTGILQLMLRLKLGAVFDVRTALMGVLPGYRGRGIDAVVVLATIEASAACGYAGGELSWVLDNNHRLRNFLEEAGAVLEKEYALYEKQL